MFKVLNNMHLKLLLIHFRNKHILSPTYDIIVKLELLQCELRITDLKVFDFLDLRYRVLSNYNLNSFKSQIRSWKPEGFPCRLCKPYLDGARIYKLKPSVISLFFKTSNSDIIHVSMSCELLEFCVWFIWTLRDFFSPWCYFIIYTLISSLFFISCCNVIAKLLKNS